MGRRLLFYADNTTRIGGGHAFFNHDASTLLARSDVANPAPASGALVDTSCQSLPVYISSSDRGLSHHVLGAHQHPRRCRRLREQLVKEALEARTTDLEAIRHDMAEALVGNSTTRSAGARSGWEGNENVWRRMRKSKDGASRN